jgi:hypothetical protein
MAGGQSFPHYLNQLTITIIRLPYGALVSKPCVVAPDCPLEQP